MPHTAFGISPRSGRRKRVCLICEEQRGLKGETSKPWDWADAVYKGLKQRWQVDAKEGELLVAGTEQLNPAVLRGIMHAQGYCCPLLGYSFVLPQAGSIPKHGTLTKWADSDEIRPNKCKLPVLVRVNNYVPWLPGNLIFIAKGLELIYGYAKQKQALPIAELRDKKIKIPSREDIAIANKELYYLALGQTNEEATA